MERSRRKIFASLLLGAVMAAVLFGFNHKLLENYKHQRQLKTNQIETRLQSPDEHFAVPKNVWNTGLQPVFYNQPLNSAGHRKRILFWTTYNRFNGFGSGWGQKPFSKCEFNQCLLTKDRSQYGISDAVIFHLRARKEELLPLPTTRKLSQPWFYLNMESPYHDLDHMRGTSFNGLFNHTISYRLDSDVPFTYGDLRPYLPWEERPQQDQDYLSGKSKMVAWFVSHCDTPSQREKYVDHLKKHISVDIYGRCGTLKCTQWGVCDQMLNKDYKFYLSFENSICRDYVTEKLWRVMKLDIIPIVLGGYNYKKYLPAKSYIDVLDFRSPKDLSIYLHKLARNKDLYNEYFKWKRHLKSSTVFEHFEPVACQVCKLLHVSNHASTQKVYQRLDKWWNIQTDCMNATEYFTSRNIARIT